MSAGTGSICARRPFVGAAAFGVTLAASPVAAQTQPFAWFQAAASGDVAVLQQMLDQGQPVDAVDAESNAAIHLAADKCQAPAVRLLLSRGADRFKPNKWNDTPFRIAAVKCGERSETATALGDASAPQFDRATLARLLTQQGKALLVPSSGYAALSFTVTDSCDVVFIQDTAPGRQTNLNVFAAGRIGSVTIARTAEGVGFRSTVPFETMSSGPGGSSPIRHVLYGYGLAARSDPTEFISLFNQMIDTCKREGFR